jgi:TonB-dependent starch-binding outer membrane protein SusC
MQIKAHFHPVLRAQSREKGWLTKTMLVMRLTGILLFGAVLHVSAASYGQTVTYSAQGAPLTKVFAAVEKQTGYVFFYDKQDLLGTVPVTVALKDVSLTAALQAILKDEPVTFDIQGNTIAITRVIREPKGKDTTSHAGKVPDVTGTVSDETGEPLSGASIKLANGDYVGITDAKGRFTLKNIKSDATLVISYTGYAEKKVQVDGKANFKVTMSLATNKLDEAQVIAYGTTTQRMSTGDGTIVTAKEIEEQPVANPLAALEGRVPGLFITQTTGAPGGGFTVQIRGQNSILNGNDPFYVIDGVPYNSEIPTLPSNTSGLVNNTLQGGNPLNFINPSDIESIEVLKDADATAIYGSRAANGAILITTKKGKPGVMKIDVNAYSGYTSPDHDIKLMNNRQYLTMRNEAFNNDGITPASTDYDVNGTWDSTRYTNWSKTLIDNTAQYSDAEGAVSGGSTSTQYLISGGYYHQITGFPRLLSGSGADDKASVHFNLNNISTDKKFKISLTSSYVSDVNTVQSVDFSSVRLTLSPDAPPLYNPDRSLDWAPLVPGQAGTWANPYANLYIGYRGVTSNLVANSIISYTVLPGLEIKASLGYNNTQTNEVQTYPTTSNDPGLNITSGNSNFNAINTHSWIIEPQANYKLHLGKGLLTALVGGSFHENISNVQTIAATGFVSDALLGDVQAASSTSIGSNSFQYKYEAAFGRLNYIWQDKYLVDFTARRDGSSRFGPGKQFADFGALGIGWIFTKESWLQHNLPFLSFGKLRGSYGTTGNDQIGNYQYLNLYSVNAFPYAGFQGIHPSSLFNPDLAWELTKKVEGGIEVGLLKDRVNAQISYYRNRSGNELLITPLSAVTGFGSVYSNLPALVQNEGLEVVINTTNIKTKNFSWISSFNYSMPSNKLIAYPGLSTSPYSSSFIVGKPLSIKRLFHYIGVNDSTGVYEFSDSKGTPTYSPSSTTDETSVINVNPKFYGGFGNSFQYKEFGLDILLQFVKKIGENMFGAYTEQPGTMYNEPTAYLNRWQKPGDEKKFEQFSQSYSSNASEALHYAQSSSFIYSDASFVRLKNLAISWQLPGNWRQKAHLDNCRVYFQAQNLITFTKYFGIDPESQGTGLPPMRVLTLGFQMKF